MGKMVVHGAQLRCEQGSSPAQLVVTGHGTEDAADAATIEDYRPMTNIPAFGLCRAQANPQVASATSAALGVLTPQPCIPVINAPWSPGSSVVTINDEKVLTADSTCTCQWSGLISIVDAGGVTEID
jgi:hypothetical protein